jgi:hypothetical protein
MKKIIIRNAAWLLGSLLVTVGACSLGVPYWLILVAWVLFASAMDYASAHPEMGTSVEDVVSAGAKQRLKQLRGKASPSQSATGDRAADGR